MSGFIRGASVEIDCSSWSRARDIPNGPPRLRDDFDGLWGLPSLIGKPLQQVLLANSLWKWVFRFLKIARLCEIPFLIENPKSSRLWLTPQAAAIRGWPQASFVVADFCQYGTDYKKPTGLLCYRLPRVAAAAKTCSPVQGRCSRTGCRHRVLQGKDANGRFLTKAAEVYPTKFANVIAEALVFSMPQPIPPTLRRTP